MILLAILCPPLYFFLSGKTTMGILGALSAILSIFLLMTVVLIPAALLLWGIFGIAAIRHCKREEAEELLTKHARDVGLQVATQVNAARQTSGDK